MSSSLRIMFRLFLCTVSGSVWVFVWHRIVDFVLYLEIFRAPSSNRVIGVCYLKLEYDFVFV